jgi:hypothetical protein
VWGGNVLGLVGVGGQVLQQLVEALLQRRAQVGVARGRLGDAPDRLQRFVLWPMVSERKLLSFVRVRSCVCVCVVWHLALLAHLGQFQDRLGVPLSGKGANAQPISRCELRDALVERFLWWLPAIERWMEAFDGPRAMVRAHT